MGRTKKKPGYDQNRIMEQFQNCIVEAYTSGISDGSCISLRQVSEEFGITLMKTRKILITAGVYHTENNEQINSMREQGMSISEIMKETGLSKSSVHSYLPYTKIIYNVDELSLYAERCRMYRKRKQAVDQLQICKGTSLEFEAIYMIPGWTHNIINLSDTEDLVTVMTCNEIFDPGHPDTFGEPV